MGEKETISAIIITYNEEENIKECLESVKWVNEIVLIDSFSTDKTIQICKEYTDKIIQRTWQGYGIQKQFALQEATSDWVLSIDADERVSPKLKDEILSKKLDKDAYYIPFKFYWLGKNLRFGGCGKEKHIRLFKRQKANFNKEPIHERLLIDGEIGYLKNPIFHFSYRNIADYFERFNHYTTIGAERKFKEGKKAVLTLQIVLSIFDFCNRYIIKLGFLDGIPGFLWQGFSAFHRLVKYAKLWEMRKEK